MEGHTLHQHQNNYAPGDVAAGGQHARPGSQGLESNWTHDANADHDHDSTRRSGQSVGVNDRVSRRGSHLRTTSYTSHIRSSSRVSWDGRVALRTSSHNHSRSSSPSPPQSPTRRSRQPRPLSAISVPDYARGRASGLRDRWSYDRERMPSPQGSRPGTPLSMSEHEAFSRPASTFIDSRTPSRPQSVLLTDLEYPHTPRTPSTPILRVIPPPSDTNGAGQPQEQPLKRQSYHLLTGEELDMLSRPPPAHPPMSAAPSPAPSTPSPGASAAKLANEASYAEGPRHDEGRHHDGHGEVVRGPKPGCCGLCEISTARAIGGKFGGWLMGMAVPVTFGVVSGCIAAVTGCR